MYYFTKPNPLSKSLFLFLFLSLNTLAQNIDSLLIEARKTNNDSTLLHTYARLGFKTIFSDSKKAHELIKEGKAYANKVNHKKWLAELKNIHGIYFIINENYDSARVYIERALVDSKKLNLKKLEGKCVNNLGMVNWNQGKFEAALKYFFDSLKIYEEREKEEDTTSALSNIGLIYQEMNLYNKALEYHKKAIDLRKKYNIINELPISYNNIGICYRKRKQSKEAEESYLECIKWSKKTNDKISLSKCYSNLGNLYQDLNKINKSILAHLKSIEILQGFDKIGKEQLFSYSSIISGYNKINNLKEAKQYAEKGLAILDKNPDFANYADEFLLSSSETFFRLGYAKKGRELSEKSQIIKDSVFSKEAAKSITDLEAKYETEKKEKELLKTQAEKATTELKLSKQKTLSYGLIGGLGLLMLIGYSLFQRNKRKHQLAISLQKETGLQAIIQAEENERTKIARELHDGVVQQIGSVILKSRNLLKNLNLQDKPESKELIESLENSNQELRTISHQMMPRALTELGIISALNDLIEGSLGQTNIKHTFEHFNINKRLPKKVETTIYRVTQELVNNIIKHSKANEVSVQLFKTDTNAVLIIEDNGVGISETNTKKGIGLLNIASRLDMVSGNVNFEPSPQSGTLVTVKIPI